MKVTCKREGKGFRMVLRTSHGGELTFWFRTISGGMHFLTGRTA